jgi:hypothetical protein
LRFLFNLFLMLAIALATGFGLSWYALTDGRFFGAYQSGPWTAWLRAGSPEPDPYTRAYLTRNAALQLGLSEGVQFVATNDSDGQPLNRACRYRIDGRTPMATFWTLVPTAPDGTPIARTGGPSGFHSNRIARANDGSIQLYVSRSLAPLNWLEITGDGPFWLVLTLYDTTLFSGVSSDQTVMPSVIREGC